MSALGKIRSHGKLLVTVIGFALFAFIAEELVRASESSQNDRRQQVGEVLGEKISVQEFQKLVDEYQEAIKMQQGTDNLDEQQLNQVKDMAWQNYVQNKILEHETEAIGITVTDAELHAILKQGTNPMLLSTPFVNQQTGRFDATMLQKFLAEYKTNGQNGQNGALREQYTRLYNYWTFIEKNLRQQLLGQKYQALLGQCFLSNPVEAKMAFADQQTESTIELAAFPYADIADDKVKVADADLKAKYDEMKDEFFQAVESRDLKYVTFTVTASQADRAALQKQMAQYQAELAAAQNPADVVSKANSSVTYLGVPAPKNFYPADIAQRLDSIAVGQTTGVTESAIDNSLNIVRLVARQSLPDSVQFRAIQVADADAAKAQASADSIATAVKAGADFAVVAKKYGQTGEQTWITAQQILAGLAQANSADQRAMAATLRGAKGVSVVKLAQGAIVVDVTDQRAYKDNYQAAVVKRAIDFSKDTYRAAFNKFSSFVSASTSLDAMQKQAQSNGYMVMPLNDVVTSSHYVANIQGTRDALKWVFEAKEGEVSPMYECGNNNQLLVLVLDKIHEKGYRTLDDSRVRDLVRSEVVRDKKAEQIAQKLSGVTSIAAAKAKGGKVASVQQISFSAPTFITTVGASEPALSGAVAATKKGAFSKKPVKGQAGMYLFQVTGRTSRPGKFDDKAMEQQLQQRAMQMAGNFMNELVMNAGVVDNRYLFF